MSWTVAVDLGDQVRRMGRIELGLRDREKLHALLVLEGQKWVFQHWPGGPPLSELTLDARARGGSAVLQDSGRLRLSITGRNPGAGIADTDGTLNRAGDDSGQFGTNLYYAAPHQFGAIIRPTRAKYLAVPLTPEASRSGGPRNFPRPLALWPLKGRNGFFLVDGEEHEVTRGPNKGKTHVRPVHVSGGYPPAQFLLVKEVEIPARPFMPTSEEFTPQAVRVVAYVLGQLAQGNDVPLGKVA